MQKITPSLWFEYQCEEAIYFYISVINSNPAKRVESKILSIKRYLSEPMPGLPMDGLQVRF